MVDVRKTFLNMQVPPASSVLTEANKLVSDPNSRIENLSLCISQDPFLSLEILKKANSMLFTDGKASTTSIKNAIIRLGRDAIKSILFSLQAIKEPKEEIILNFLNLYRDKSKRVSIVTRIFTKVIDKNLEEDCSITGLYTYLAYILSALSFKEDFLEFPTKMPLATLRFKIEKKYKINIEESARAYLRKNNIVNSLVDGLDKEEQIKNDKKKLLLRNIVWSSFEFVEAFDSNNWGKLASTSNISSKSSIRTLLLTEKQYNEIYNRAAGFFISHKLLQSHKKASEQELENTNESSLEQTLDLECKEEKRTSDVPLEKDLKIKISKEECKVEQLDSLENKKKVCLNVKGFDNFKLDDAVNNKKFVPRKRSSEIVFVEPEKSNIRKTNKLAKQTEFILDTTLRSEDALEKILNALIKNNAFKRTALIVISEDRKSGLVVYSRGILENGQMIDITDELSPLAQCFLKLQSYGNKESENSPFGSKSYAISPIDADHPTPVILYADCGDDILTFESRRVFRAVVDVLNQKLPTLPGGIPIEVKKS